MTTGIDAVIGCHQCGGQLDGSPSHYFCSEDCRQAWHTARTEQPRPADALARAAQAMAPRIADLARIAEAVFADLGRAAATAHANLRALAATPGMRRHAIMTRALDARQNRNTGPARASRPPRRLDR